MFDEAADPFLRRALDRDHDEHCGRDQEEVAQPGVELRQMQSIEKVRLMDEVPQVKVQDIKAVAGLSYDSERIEAEETGDKVVSGEAEDSEPE